MSHVFSYPTFSRIECQVMNGSRSCYERKVIHAVGMEEPGEWSSPILEGIDPLFAPPSAVFVKHSETILAAFRQTDGHALPFDETISKSNNNDG